MCRCPQKHFFLKQQENDNIPSVDCMKLAGVTPEAPLSGTYGMSVDITENLNDFQIICLQKEKNISMDTFQFRKDPLGHYSRKVGLKNIKGDTHLDMSAYGIKNTWAFALHPKMRLNLTFHNLQIFIMNLYDCFIGNLTVYTFLAHHNVSHVFCGIYSSVIVYPTYNNVEVIMLSEYRVQYEVNMSHSVIDSNVVVSSVVNATTENRLKGKYNSQPIWKFLAIFTENCIEKFHIVANKFEKLKIYATYNQSSELSVEMYDGPGTLCELITYIKKDDTKYYITSQFQSLLYIYYKKQAKVSTVDYETMYLSKLNEIYIDPERDTSIMYSTAEMNFKEVVFFRLRAPSYKTINLTISTCIHEGIASSKCLYSGIAIYDTLDRYGNSTYCNPHNYNMYKSVYSKKDVLYVIIYSYMAYSYIEMKLKISLTTCKVIPFNVCHVEGLIEYLDKTSVSYYRNILKQYMGYPYFGYRNGFPGININVNISELCIVLQLVHDMDVLVKFPNCKGDKEFFRKRPYCTARNIGHVFPLEWHGRVNYITTGFLSGIIISIV